MNFNFWDSNVWGFVNVVGTLLASLIAANMIKRSVKFLKYSLVPTSVLGGILLLIITTVYEFATGNTFFNTNFYP